MTMTMTMTMTTASSSRRSGSGSRASVQIDEIETMGGRSRINGTRGRRHTSGRNERVSVRSGGPAAETLVNRRPACCLLPARSYHEFPHAEARYRPGQRKRIPAAESAKRYPQVRVILNIVIVLTSAPVLLFEGGPKAVVVTLKIMAGISVLIWTATFAVFSIVTLPWIFRTPVSLVRRCDSAQSTEEPGVVDRSIDESI